MRKVIQTGIKAVVILLRIFLYPLKLVVFFFYPDMRPTTVGYAWYSRDEYQKLIDSSRDNLDELVPTYDLWKAKANEKVANFQKKGFLVVKVRVEVKELEKWLKAKWLPNTGENREKYVNDRMKKFFEDGII